VVFPAVIPISLPDSYRGDHIADLNWRQSVRLREGFRRLLQFLYRDRTYLLTSSSPRSFRFLKSSERVFLPSHLQRLFQVPGDARLPGDAIARPAPGGEKRRGSHFQSMKTMRILHLFSNWKWTGPADPVLNLCKGLSHRGHDVTLATEKPLCRLRQHREKGLESRDQGNGRVRPESLPQTLPAVFLYSIT